MIDEQKSIPQGEEEVEVCGAERGCHGMQVREEGGEESEERLRLEFMPLLLMGISKNEDEDGEDLREIVDLGLVVVHPRGITVILDDVHDEPGEGVECLEGIVQFACRDALDVGCHAGLGADTEEERGYVLCFQDSVLRQVGNERNEVLLGGGSPLEHSDPVLEPHVQLLAQLLGLRFEGSPRSDVD